jgi:hypothetical protein
MDGETDRYTCGSYPHVSIVVAFFTGVVLAVAGIAIRRVQGRDSNALSQS